MHCGELHLEGVVLLALLVGLLGDVELQELGFDGLGLQEGVDVGVEILQ